MPAVGAVIGAIAGAIGGAVSAVAGAIGSAIGGAVSAIGSAIGSAVSAITSVIGPVVSAITKTVGGIVGGITSALGGALEGIVGTVSSAVKPFVDGLTSAIDTVTSALRTPIQNVVDRAWAMMSGTYSAINNAVRPILTPIKDGLEAVLGAVKKVEAWVDTTLEPIKDVVEIVNQVASLKILYDLVRGQASITELIDKVAAGESDSTAAAIARLSKEIITTTVSIVDKVDTQFDILKASVDSFDEKLKMSLAELREEIDARFLTVITPRLDTLGDTQEKTLRAVAALYRHIEDEPWFAAMLLKVLP